LENLAAVLIILLVAVVAAVKTAVLEALKVLEAEALVDLVALKGKEHSLELLHRMVLKTQEAEQAELVMQEALLAGLAALA
jgi:hypothetical protein